MLKLLLSIQFQDLFNIFYNFFSPFLHSTFTLSLNQDYYTFKDGSLIFEQT